MKILFIVPIILLCSSCWILVDRSSGTSNRSDISHLIDKQERYLDLLKTSDLVDQHGFITTDHCDTVLFSALAAIGGLGEGNPDYLLAARDENGQWFRRPAKDCLKKGKANSTISRDMFMGIILWATYHERLDILEDIRSYGVKRDWIMGEANSVDGATKINFTQNIIYQLENAIVFLGGNRNHHFTNTTRYTSKTAGYQSHLQALAMILEDKTEGGLSPDAIDVIKVFYKNNPQNSLFIYLHEKFVEHNSDFPKTRANLEGRFYPEDRLPTNRDRKTPWIPERDAEGNYHQQTDGEEVIHTGGDFLFMMRLLRDNSI